MNNQHQEKITKYLVSISKKLARNMCSEKGWQNCNKTWPQSKFSFIIFKQSQPGQYNICSVCKCGYPLSMCFFLVNSLMLNVPKSKLEV